MWRWEEGQESKLRQLSRNENPHPLDREQFHHWDEVPVPKNSTGALGVKAER
jgi:hypothetical protein